jgi:hypothetical protein
VSLEKSQSGESGRQGSAATECLYGRGLCKGQQGCAGGNSGVSPEPAEPAGDKLRELCAELEDADVTETVKGVPCGDKQPEPEQRVQTDSEPAQLKIQQVQVTVVLMHTY